MQAHNLPATPFKGGEMEITKEMVMEIRMTEKWIKKEDLIEGCEYYCRARNFQVGRWNGKEFCYVRVKFGQYFMDKEYHWDDGPPNGTVQPIMRIKL
jgi:hypothetical protein